MGSGPNVDWATGLAVVEGTAGTAGTAGNEGDGLKLAGNG